MKKMAIAVLVLVCLLSLFGCQEDPVPDNVLVFLEEANSCTVENNGQRVAIGEDAVFTIKLGQGYSLTETDYAGASDINTSGRTVTLTLQNVQYPSRVHLCLASRYNTVTYMANGGQPLHGNSLQESKTYDLTFHARPNTSIGTDLFVRDGFTLIGWNTRADGSGTEVGLGSRVSVPDGMITLYAQWAQWSPSSDFSFEKGENGVTITGYHGGDDTVVVPARIDGMDVTAVAEGAFDGCPVHALVFPATLRDLASGAVRNCPVQSVTLYDNIVTIGDSSFENCPDLKTLCINAMEAPFGYSWRKESCYADKVDRLILSQDQNRAVFYGGCSMWYNLDGLQAQQALGDSYTVVNMGLNGTVNSPVQMQILGSYLHEGDIVIHTPELYSRKQLLISPDMGENDDLLWCGIENNYDLFKLVDLTTVDGVLDSLCHYLSMKNTQASYAQHFQDESGQAYLDQFGCIPFFRSSTEDELGDKVRLDPALIDKTAMAKLGAYYDWFQSKGARVYVSYACVNLDAVPAEQQGNVALMDSLVREAVEQMEGVSLISHLEDYIFQTSDFFDTNYHLISVAAEENTALWLRDLQAQMEQDGI